MPGTIYYKGTCNQYHFPLMFFCGSPWTLTSSYRKCRKSGFSSANNKVSYCSTPTDMTIMDFPVNVGYRVIIWPSTLFKHPVYPHDWNHSPNAIKFHFQMCFPRVWGKYGFTDLPKIAVLNHWQHKHCVLFSSAFHYFVSNQSPVNLDI